MTASYSLQPDGWKIPDTSQIIPLSADATGFRFQFIQVAITTGVYRRASHK